VQLLGQLKNAHLRRFPSTDLTKIHIVLIIDFPNYGMKRALSVMGCHKNGIESGTSLHWPIAKRLILRRSRDWQISRFGHDGSCDRV
jgi:hypothetical protein